MTAKRKETEEAKSIAIREGMRRAAASGRHVGRPRGSGKSGNELLRHHPGVVAALERGLSLREAAKASGVAVNTVRKVKALLPVSPVQREAHPSSSLPLRPVAVTVTDWRRYDGKRGDLLVCGHFVPEPEWDTGEPRRARRCPRCAKRKGTNRKKGSSLSPTPDDTPTYAVALLDHPYNMDKKNARTHLLSPPPARGPFRRGRPRKGMPRPGLAEAPRGHRSVAGQQSQRGRGGDSLPQNR